MFVEKIFVQNFSSEIFPSNFFLPVRPSACPSVRPSVRPKIFRPAGRPKIFRRAGRPKIFRPTVRPNIFRPIMPESAYQNFVERRLNSYIWEWSIWR